MGKIGKRGGVREGWAKKGDSFDEETKDIALPRERGLLFAYDGIQNSLAPEKEASSSRDANIASRRGPKICWRDAADMKQIKLSLKFHKFPVANAADQSL